MIKAIVTVTVSPKWYCGWFDGVGHVLTDGCLDGAPHVKPGGVGQAGQSGDGDGPNDGESDGDDDEGEDTTKGEFLADLDLNTP